MIRVVSLGLALALASGGGVGEPARAGSALPSESITATSLHSPARAVTPLETAPLRATQVASDGDGYCALLRSRTVKCWGSGTYGQLGNGHFSDSATAVPVVSTTGSGVLAGVKSLTGSGYAGFAAGYCALLLNGTVDCWGDGTNGALGTGSLNESPTAVPVVVLSTTGTGPLRDAASVTASIDGDGYCALLLSRSVVCWGASSPKSTFQPAAVPSPTGLGSLTSVASLTAGSGGFCALLTTRAVDCWGYGELGALGNGSLRTSTTPVAVISTSGTGVLGDVTSVTYGGDGYCAVLRKGTVNCWGYGADGALGNGKYRNSATAVSVLAPGGKRPLSGVRQLASDQFLTARYGSAGENSDGYCALLTSSAVVCWGLGTFGELGNAASRSSAVAVYVTSVLGPGVLQGVATVTGNNDTYCAVMSWKRVNCWGGIDDIALGTPRRSLSSIPATVVSTTGAASLQNVVALTADGTGYCALLSSGGVDCWGFGWSGELGNGKFDSSYAPVIVS